MLEQFSLETNAVPVGAQRSVGPHDPVTRHEGRNLIARAGSSRSADGTWASCHFRQLRVADGGTT